MGRLNLLKLNQIDLYLLSLFDECSCFVYVKRQKKRKKISVCLSICLDVRTYVDFSCGHNNFREFQNFKKSIFFCLFNNTICLEYSLLYGARIDDSM